MARDRNPRSDSAAAAVQAAQNAAEGPRDPLDYYGIPEHARPLWDAVMRNRPRHRWNELDMAHAANLVLTMLTIRDLHASIEQNGHSADLHKLLDINAKRAMGLSRFLQVHAEATIGRAEDNAKTLALENESAAEHDDLIPTL